MAVEKLRTGEKIIGSMCRLVRNPGIAHAAKESGLDFIMLDMEHSTYSMENFFDVAAVARSIDLGIFVRVPELTKGYISRVMDAGADGVMVPMLSTEEEARQLVRWSRYTPLGNRGYGSSGAYMKPGAAGNDTLSLMAEMNRRTLAIAQIETSQAVENADKIAAVPGIDVLLVGPSDLSISLGVAGETTGDVVGTAIALVASAAKKHQKVFSIHAGPTLLDRWVDEMGMIMCDLDTNILKAGFREIAEKYR